MTELLRKLQQSYKVFVPFLCVCVWVAVGVCLMIWETLCKNAICVQQLSAVAFLTTVATCQQQPYV